MAATSGAAAPAVRLIQAGLGGWGRNWYKNILKPSREIEVVAWVDNQAESLSAAQGQESVPAEKCYAAVEDALEKVESDALLVTASLPGHVPLVLAGLRAGKHVLVEKPFAPSLRDAEALVREAEKAGRVLMVSQNYRFYPAPRKAAELVAGGELGKLGAVYVDFRKNRIESGNLRHYQLPDPLLADMAIHHFDLMRLVTGKEPKRLYCRAWNPPWSPYDGLASASAIVEMDGDLTVSYNGSWVSTGPETYWAGEWRMELTGGEILWTSRDDMGKMSDRLVVRPAGGRERKVPLEPTPYVDRAGSLHAFVEAIGGNSSQPYENAGADNKSSLAMVFASIEAVETGRVAEIRP